jgi:hypothetical protein
MRMSVEISVDGPSSVSHILPSQLVFYCAVWNVPACTSIG